MVLQACANAGEKRVAFENGTLTLAIAPEAGEAGAFYEDEIAREISRGLELETKPVIKDLEHEAEHLGAATQGIFPA